MGLNNRLFVCAQRYCSAVAGVFLIAVGCAGTSNRVMTGYDHMKVAESNCGVVLIKKNLQVMNPEDLAHDFGSGGPEEGYYSFFGAEFPSAMGKCSKFKSVCFLPGADDILTQRAGAKSDNSILRAALPTQRHFISDTLDYLLIIDYLTMSHMRKTSTPVAGGSDGNFNGFFSGAEALTHSADFVLWDNKAGTIAAYGSIAESVPVYDTIVKSAWRDMIKQVARAASAGMPYGK